jgi:polar amino acid transport system substrate-binding protein
MKRAKQEEAMKLLTSIVLGAAMLLTAAAPAFAQQQSTLDEIIKSGTINVGVGLGTPPYGLTNAEMQPDGYDVSVAKLIARDLGVKLNLVDTTAANRIPNLTSGKLDIVIYSFSITAERAKVIAFTDTYYVDSQVYVGPADKAAASVAELVGKNVGVTRASTNDIVMTKHAVEGTNIQRYDDDASTSQALLSGQVDGIVTSGALARAITQQDPNLKTFFTVASAPMAIRLRRNDPDFLHWLNTELFMLKTTGEIQALQEKWMGGSVDLPTF